MKILSLLAVYFGLLVSTILAGDCNNPLLTLFNISKLDAPTTVTGLKYCKSLQSGQSCCSAETVNGFQAKANDLAEKLKAIVASRDRQLVEARDTVLPQLKANLQDLRNNSQQALNVLKAKMPNNTNGPQPPQQGGNQSQPQQPPLNGSQPNLPPLNGSNNTNGSQPLPPPQGQFPNNINGSQPLPPPPQNGSNNTNGSQPLPPPPQNGSNNTNGFPLPPPPQNGSNNTNGSQPLPPPQGQFPNNINGSQPLPPPPQNGSNNTNSSQPNMQPQQGNGQPHPQQPAPINSSSPGFTAAASLVETLGRLSQEVVDGLPGIKGNFSNFQKSRSTCVVQMVKMQAAAWCLSCDPNYASKGVSGSSGLQLSSNTCGRLQTACFDFISQSSQQSSLLSIKNLAPRIGMMATGLQMIIADNSTGLSELTNAIEGADNNATAAPPVALPPNCTAGQCPWICTDLFSNGQVNQTLVTAGGALEESTSDVSASGSSRLLVEEGTAVKSKLNKRRVLQSSEWNPDQDEAGVEVTFAADPANVNPTTSDSSYGTGLVGTSLAAVFALLALFLI